MAYVSFQQARTLGYAQQYRPSYLQNDCQVTTLALNEEGGGAWGYCPVMPIDPQPIDTTLPTSISTFSAFQVLREADRSGSPWGYGGDGQISKSELTQYTKALETQQSWLDRIRPYVNSSNPLFQNLSRAIQDRLNSARFLSKNFDGIAKTDGQNNGISGNDLINTANNDGNIWNITQSDVTKNDNQSKPLYSRGEVNTLYNQSNTDGRNGITKTEINDYATRLKDLISRIRSGSASALQRQYDLSQLVLTNFDKIAQLDTTTGSNRVITTADLRKLMGLDGNSNSLSDSDISKL